ncbi:sodium/potassium-transporting ATPase subunit beta-1-like [Wyeomyia smithii]|uniref:sodium/potassium-transporting ATPase subunit beta-1-like n=1 Tax=Wyeomyia smithii TaxID=174621 RepID=UPI002467B3D1|nr:sodium/potassium-transporting ATPase subunit beta-1-like [Wyeomyia smithii]
MVKHGEKKVDKEYVFVFPQKPEPKTWRQIIWDEEERKFFGRTKQSWFYLFLFYGVYFIILFAVFWGCMEGLFRTVNDQYPYYQQADSLIGVNPGLGVRPLPQNPKKPAIIHFKPGGYNAESDYWVTQLNEFLQPYYNTSILPGEGKNHVKCEHGMQPPPESVCSVDTKQFGPCNPDNKYGYNSTQPCVFLKLNRIYGWEPVYYDDVNELPENMPHDLVEYIKSLPVEDRKQLWVSCNGVYPADQEAVGIFRYYPSRGIPSSFYPYTNTKGYLSPLIAIQFTKSKRKQNMFVECRAWAKNIKYHGGSRLRMGSVLFSMLIE